VKEAVALLHDLLANSKFDEQQVEAEKEAVYRQATCTQCPKTVVVEALHYRSFEDHFLGQPVRGIRENVHNIKADQVQAFHKQYYIGSNIVVSGAGNVDHQQLSDAVSETFGKLPQSSAGAIANANQPYFTAGLTFMRDDEQKNTSAGVGLLAPGYTHPDFLGMRFLKRLLGKYRVDKYTGAHLNSPYLQYNTMHARLGSYPDILMHEPFYYPYSDVGLFGNFQCGNDVFNNQLIFMTQSILTEYASRV
jgi:predicted Zn-dependent peptidase